jgi:integrase
VSKPTPGIKPVTTKKGQVRYQAFVNAKVADPTSDDEYRWKLIGKRFKRLEDARNWRLKMQSENKTGAHVEPTEKTIAEMFEKWMEVGKKQGFRKNGRPWKIQTLIRYQIILDKHIKPALGSTKASGLKRLAIEQAAQAWKETTSAQHANNIWDALNACYKWALKHPDTFGVTANPMGFAERPLEQAEPVTERMVGDIADHREQKPHRGTLRAIDPSETYSALEQKKLIEASEPGYEKAFFMTAIFTGLRHGELCGLTWDNIDLKTGVLRVNGSLTQLPKRFGGSRLEPPRARRVNARSTSPRCWRLNSRSGSFNARSSSTHSDSPAPAKPTCRCSREYASGPE